MGNDRTRSLVSGEGFLRGQLGELEKAEVLDQFGGRLVTDVLGVVGDGKEATVYACAAAESASRPFLAAKVYRAQKFRAFRGGQAYAGTRTPMNGRARRAIASHSQKGREFEQREWIAWEWQTLSRLHSVGASVPEPVARSSIAILMELIGDEGEGAPKLVHVELTPAQARSAFDSLLRDVEDFLDLHLVHGDLSAYNVLWHDDRPRIIDVPQAIDLHGRP
ncbi:MAG TPA: RIO1 family regulatory kinase/ATPase, partial [Myxococcota bacterium]|nr:RIO1 family regulatory kinase/ATPase [Myxococcota bacterium]